MLLDELRIRWNQALSYRGSCPCCDSDRVWHNGIRLRTASLLDGDETVFVADVPARRLRCGTCGARWTHAPDGVNSRGHHQPCVVAHAVAAVALDPMRPASVIANEHRCDRRSLGRWLARVAGVADPAVLAAAVVRESAVPVVPSPPPTVRPSRSERRSNLLSRAVWVLLLLEALASLRGLEPPALAHARELVPGNAASAWASGGASSARERKPTGT